MGIIHTLLRKLATFTAVLVALLLGFLPTVMPNQPVNAASDSTKVQKFRNDVLHVKLSDQVSLISGQFSGTPADQVATLNTLLVGAGKIKTERIKNGTDQTAIQSTLSKKLDHYFRISFKQAVDVTGLVGQLKTLGIVQEAYAEPTAAPSPTTANYVSLQNYLKATPDGVNSNYAQTFPGGSGSSAKIIDVEYSWNTNHEDLSKARTALVPNGTPVDPFNDNNHGTAVVGEMVSDKNTFGVTGVAPGASLLLINANNAERGYDPANALYLAASRAAPGDVVIIEQQTWGPTSDTYDFVPVEWIPEVYDAIKALTNAGVIVVEPAGNGSQNLDDSTYYGTSFPMGKPDSGAIVVGAAYNCSTSPRLSRMNYSDYGRRVNVQGPGECVTTTGYGDLSGSDPNSYYTSGFNGTSSATPVIAAAAASLSSAYKTLNANTVLTPLQIRDTLIANATPQNTASGTLSGNIGPYPDLAKALLVADKTAPSTPINLIAKQLSGKKLAVSVTWNAASDNVKVTAYRVYRNGVLYATVTTPNFNDTTIAKGKTYTYQVVAVDASGNASVSSTSASVAVK